MNFIFPTRQSRQEAFDFNTFRYNLEEIKGATHKTTNIGKMRFYTYSNDVRLYNARSLLTRIWLWIRSWFYSESAEDSERKVEKALIYTIHDLFNRFVGMTYQSYEDYLKDYIYQVKSNYPIDQQTNQQSLEEALRSYRLMNFYQDNPSSSQSQDVRIDISNEKISRLTESDLRRIRNQMSTCNEAVLEIWNDFVRTSSRYNFNIDGLKASLRNASKEEYSLILSKNLYRLFKQAQSLINLEAVLQDPVPISSLAKLCDSQPLSSKDEQTISKWIKKLNKRIRLIQPSDFKRALKQIVEIIRLEGSQPSVTIERLAMKLDDRGCELISYPDSQHISWRRELKKGDIINCNQGRYMLGDLLGEERPEDRYIVFNIEGDPAHVLRIGRNRLELGLEASKFERLDQHWGMHPIKIKEIDSNGRCMIIEKLEMFQPNWISQSYIIDKSEEESALLLANHIWWMADWRVTPKDLDGRYIGRNVEGILKSTHMLPKTIINFNELEEWCLSLGCAKKPVQAAKLKKKKKRITTTKDLNQINWPVITFILHVSNVVEHPIARFYKGAISKVIEKGKSDLTTRTPSLSFEDHGYKEHAMKLCEKAETLVIQCYDDVKLKLEKMGRHDPINDNELEAKIRNTLAELYLDSPLSGILPSEVLKNKILEVFINNKSLQEVKLSSNVKQYYQQSIQKLEANNNLARRQNENPV